MAAAIEIRHVSKHFRLYHEHYSSLKEKMINFGRIPFEDFVALNDIDIDIEAGTTVGILGHNGSGKSTLLKCVAGILQPNEGEIVTRGRLAALLELGAMLGFHPELTGRENVFMNASILGLSKRDISGVFDEIVAFSELDKFIDMQVRHYSSGMYIRLGFAVAVNVDPDILLVDEVLSVGDESFQRKCLERVADFQKEGRTILFVTHAADLVRKVCERGLVLDHGELIADAAPGEAIRTFRESLQHSGLADPTMEAVEAAEAADAAEVTGEHATVGRQMAAQATNRVQITNVTIEHPGTLVGRQWLLPNEAMSIRVNYRANEPTDDLLFGIAIHDQEGNNIFGANTKVIDVPVPMADGDGEVTFDFEHVPLLDGTYLVTLAIQSTDEGTIHDWRDQQYQFSVMNPTRTSGLVSLPLEVRFGTPYAERVEGSGS